MLLAKSRRVADAAVVPWGIRASGGTSPDSSLPSIRLSARVRLSATMDRMFLGIELSSGMAVLQISPPSEVTHSRSSTLSLRHFRSLSISLGQPLRFDFFRVVDACLASSSDDRASSSSPD